MKYLNLGCGNSKFEDCINIDCRKECNPDLVCDIRELPYEPYSINGIYALDVLEHLPINLVIPTLKFWHKILEKNGFLILRLPDLGKISKKYLREKIDSNEFARLIYGGQEKNEFANFHKSGFDERMLIIILEHIGFRQMRGHIGMPCNDNNMLLKFRK